MNSYLKTLNLPIGATKAEIKVAYRKLSKKYHPDVNKSENAKEQFIAINEAYKFLMDVGPKPNKETITYDYNPQDAAFEDWRKKAQAYAWRKAKEAERHQQQQLSRLLGYFDFVAAAIVIINFLLAVDYLLPNKTFNDKIVKVSKVYEGGIESDRSSVYRYDDLYFRDFNMRVDKDSFKVSPGNETVITGTYLLKKPLYVEVTKGAEKVKLQQVYGIYTVFGYLIPIMLLVWIFYKFLLRNLDHKLALAILMLVLFPLQLFLLFAF